MKSVRETDNAINKETINFFNFITYPSKLVSVNSLQEIQQSTNDDRLHHLWNLFIEKNIQCFKLSGVEKSQVWDIYYADKEIPLIFYPIFQKQIPKQQLKQFSDIMKLIKTNLFNLFSQDLESSILLIKKDESGSKIIFYTFKLEDQGFNGKKEVKISDNTLTSLKNGKKRIPIGQRNPINRLNLLTGREWIKFSKTWFIHKPPRRNEEEILHPAKFPETMIRSFITFFTKPGELVLDPFLGSGSSLIAAKQCNRSGIGIELSSFYAEISKKRLDKLEIPGYPPIYQTKKSSFWQVICQNSENIPIIWDEYHLPPVDFCITSPPYWNQLRRNTIRQKGRKNKGLDTKYSENDPMDLGNLMDYKIFLEMQRKIFGYVYELLKPNGYLVIITNNVFADGRVYPLAYDTVLSLIKDQDHPWVLKDEKVWLQDDKALLALGVNYAWVGNRCHQYCHILR
ncbi:MAG: DNA methyltransferase, partial [Candidatus Hodarchaeota archaeon]